MIILQNYKNKLNFFLYTQRTHIFRFALGNTLKYIFFTFKFYILNLIDYIILSFCIFYFLVLYAVFHVLNLSIPIIKSNKSLKTSTYIVLRM